MRLIGIAILVLGVVMMVIGAVMCWCLYTMPTTRYTVLLRIACMLFMVGNVCRMGMVVANGWREPEMQMAGLFVQSLVISLVAISDCEFLKVLLPYVSGLPASVARNVQMVVIVMAFPFQVSSMYVLVPRTTHAGQVIGQVFEQLQVVWPAVMAAGSVVQEVIQGYVVAVRLKRPAAEYRVAYVMLVVVGVMVAVAGGVLHGLGWGSTISITSDGTTNTTSTSTTTIGITSGEMHAISGSVVLLGALVPMVSVEMLRRLLQERKRRREGGRQKQKQERDQDQEKQKQKKRGDRDATAGDLPGSESEDDDESEYATEDEAPGRGMRRAPPAASAIAVREALSLPAASGDAPTVVASESQISFS